MFIERIFWLVLFFSSIVDPCSYQLTASTGTIVFPPYDNNVECLWTFNLSLINYPISYRTLLLTFRHFDTEFGHDELWIGESIADVSTYNSKIHRFSGWKLPDPCYIPLRNESFTRSIWMQFNSDQTTTGSGFILDYVFLVNQSFALKPKTPQTSINAYIRRPSENDNQNRKVKYSYPYGTISSPNFPQNYSNNIICRWDFYQRDAFIRFYVDRFETEPHYDTLTLYLGQNPNNRAMILHEWSGQDITTRHYLIPNDRALMVFQADKSQNSSGFLIHYEIIEREKVIIDLTENNGTIHSKGYPLHLRTNMEYQWRIHMNDSDEIEIDLTDVHLDDEQDSLQIIVGPMSYILNRPRIERFRSTNQTVVRLRTKHTNTDEHYRGFHLNYRKFVHRNDQETTELLHHSLDDLPCGKKFSSPNGTIEFNLESPMSLNCLIFIEVDDGQNIFLRFDSLHWDSQSNQIEIGLHHFPNQSRLFRISDVIPGTWFVANDSQLWIRITSNEFSLGPSSLRLSYSETIQWSTVSPKSDVHTLRDHWLFPYRIFSTATVGIFQNLTRQHLWHIHASEDESVTIVFHSFQSFHDQHLCFYLSNPLETSAICTNEHFPVIRHLIGSWTLSIEPEFIWSLVEYDVEIDRAKKVTKIYQIDFHGDHLELPLPDLVDSFVHWEWFISHNHSSTSIIVDVRNTDGTTPAELFIVENQNSVKTFSLGSIFRRRFAHVASNLSSPFRIIYQSYGLPYPERERSFRLYIHKVSQEYFHDDDGFHYIAYEPSRTNKEWSIQGKNETSTFIGQIYSSDDRISLQTTADVNLTGLDIWKEIGSSDFNIRYGDQVSSTFLLILYEKMFEQLDEPVRLTKRYGVMKTDDRMSYQIDIDSQSFDLLEIIIVQGDLDMIIRLFDRNFQTILSVLHTRMSTATFPHLHLFFNLYLNLNQTDYFLFKPRETSSSVIGLRFTIRTVQLQVHLQSLTHQSIELRYNARRSSPFTDENSIAEPCWISDVKVCNNHNNSRCNEHCSNWFVLNSSTMNQTRIPSFFWPYALRGSVTLIIENVTLENFEKMIYRNLKQSIAKIVRKFCSTDVKHCLSEDADAIRSDHVIIQSYDEQFDNQRLYVALFIKDPYRPTIALTNEQVLTALQEYQDELHQEIKHQIHLPTSILEKNVLDPVWLYGVCLMALIVLLVVILMLMSVLIRRTKYRSTKDSPSNHRVQSIEQKLMMKQDKRFIPISIPMNNDEEEDEDEQTSSTCPNKTDSSQTSNSTAHAQLLPAPSSSSTSYARYAAVPTSYFNSTIESAMVRHLEEDDEPIPFIDDNLSVAYSRKSSACWSDRTSLSSRLGFSRRFNFKRSRSQLRTESVVQEQDGRKQKRRSHHRTKNLSILPQEQLRINEFV